jgi:hypothetical protein
MSVQRWRANMAKFDVLKDEPFRYIHSTKTGELLCTLIQLAGGKFVEENYEDRPAKSLRKWKAMLSRRFQQREFT